MPTPEQKKTYYILDPIADLVDAEEASFGTQKRVVNAAVLLFSQASAEEKIAAVRAIAELERTGKLPAQPSSAAALNEGTEDDYREGYAIGKAAVEAGKPKARKRGA